MSIEASSWTTSKSIRPSRYSSSFTSSIWPLEKQAPGGSDYFAQLVQTELCVWPRPTNHIKTGSFQVPFVYLENCTNRCLTNNNIWSVPVLRLESAYRNAYATQRNALLILWPMCFPLFHL